MKSFYIILIIGILHYSVSAQQRKAEKYFNKGVVCLNNEDFRAADSMFTISIDLYETADAYLNRALAKLNLGDTCSYCNDLNDASRLGNSVSNKLLWNDCIKTDTSWTPLADFSDNEKDNYHFHISRNRLCGNTKLFLIYDINNEVIRSFELTQTGILKEPTEEAPGFPGGYMAQINFIGDNIVYPSEAQKARISGQVYISFSVNEDGSLTDFEIIIGLGYGCDEEVMRIFKLMPNWMPARLSGIPVKVQTTMPISFKYGDTY